MLYIKTLTTKTDDTKLIFEASNFILFYILRHPNKIKQ